jgi:hypothetical protein
MERISCYTRAPEETELKIDQGSNDSFIAWGLLPKESPPTSDITVPLDIQCGCIRRCDYLLRRGSDKTPFAAFQMVLNDLDFKELWYLQAKPWVLQVFNSFVGSDSDVGGALGPGCFFLIWRVKARTHRCPKNLSIALEGSQTYDYFALDPTHFQAVTDENAEHLSDLFVELARICSSLKSFSRIIKQPSVISQVKAGIPFFPSCDSTEPPAKKAAFQKKARKPASSAIKRYCISQVGKGQDFWPVRWIQDSFSTKMRST